MSEQTDEPSAVNIVEFPPAAGRPALLAGPFEYYRVVVEGREIPGLTGFPQPEGRVGLIVDGRFMVGFDNEEKARQAAWLIGHAVAVAQGYAHLGSESRNEKPFAPLVTELDGLPL